MATVSIAIDRSRVTLSEASNPRNSRRKAAPPGRDAVHMVCGHPGPGLMTHHANGSLGTCNAFILVGHSYKNVTRPRLYRKHLYQENIIFQVLTTLLPRSMRSVPFRRASLLNHLVNFHQLPTFTSPPSRTAPSNNTIPTKPASAKEPLASRRIARFRTDWRVLGCTGPS